MRLGPEAAQQFRLFVRIMQTVLGALILGLVVGMALNKTLGISMSWSALFMFFGLSLGVYGIYISQRKPKD
jgi:hypothetical protein